MKHLMSDGLNLIKLVFEKVSFFVFFSVILFICFSNLVLFNFVFSFC
jgi:hypothetical protein